MNSRILAALVAVLTAVLIWVVFFFDPASGEATQAESSPQGGDFTLQSARGPVSLQDLRGKTVLLYFGYTWCPDICPTSLSVVSAALNELTAEELAASQVVFISVDPERDTPDRLKTYTEYFHESMLGVTGTKAEVDQVVKQYGAAYRMVKETDSAMDYIVDHSSSLYLIDQQGELIKTLAHGTAPGVVLSEMRALINKP